MRRWGVLGGFAALIAVLMPVAPARSEVGPPTPALPGAEVTTLGFRYLPGDDGLPAHTLFVTEGSELTYTNRDIAPHNVVDVECEKGPEYCRFRSRDTNRLNESKPVDGVADLEPGTYPFYCVVHPDMRGTLVIQGVS